MDAKVSQYRAQAGHYMENALANLQQGEMGKAGEFLWGSVAEALKGLAARKGRELRNHRELVRYGRDIARELQDPHLEAAFAKAETMHSNFYEGFLSPEEMAQDAELIREAVDKLLVLMEMSVQEPTTG